MIKSSKNQILNAEKKTMLCTKIEQQILVLTAIANRRILQCTKCICIIYYF